jgi:hypothetical protein
MPTLHLDWTPVSKPMFEFWKTRAAERGRSPEFATVTKEILIALQDLDQALERGEAPFQTKLPGGIARHWVHEFISASYVVFPEKMGWILRFECMPESWPDLS